MTTTGTPLIDRLFRGVDLFGRGVVLDASTAVPAPWRGRDELEVSVEAVKDPVDLEALVDRLHRAWVSRTPLVIRWSVDDSALGPESDIAPSHDCSAAFLFPVERLRFLCFTNSYDARDGDPIWWWTRKAERLGVTGGGDLAAGDVTLADGTTAWVDGGPRTSSSLDQQVISGEDIDAGLLALAPRRRLDPTADLAPDQLAAVDHDQGPARIVAPAGSGKTRTLTARVRHLLEGWKVDPGQILVVAYNRRAADELRGRIGVSKVAVRTVHALGWAILGESNPGLELIDEPAVRSHLNRIFSIPKRPNADPTAPYLEALDEVRIGLRSPDEVEEVRDDVPGFAAGFAAYRSRLAQRGQADHGEQVYGAIEALRADPSLRARWQRRFRHVLVDEFQDLTPAYVLLLRLVASPQLQVFGVGDDDQVIYGYAGADPAYLIDFDQLFPGASAHALSTNYRCAPSIVAAANHLLSYNRRRIDKDTGPARAPDGLAGLEVVKASGAELAATAADRICAWVEAGTGPHEIAVLTRVNSSLIPLKAALAGREIATNDLLGPESLNRSAVRALFAWIRIAVDPENMQTTDVVEAIRRPSRGLTTLARDTLVRRTTSLHDLAAAADRFDRKKADRWDAFVADVERAVDVADGGDVAELTRVLVDEIGLSAAAATLDAGRSAVSRSSHSDDLIAIRRAAALHRDPTSFIAWLRDMVSRRSDPHGVTLSSVHRVKGMEWRHVIVFGADRGSMPHELATDCEEERRIFHVAITRAMDHALVLADTARPSRFLDELDGSAAPEPERTAVPKRDRQVAPLSTGPTLDDWVTLRGGLKGVVTARSAQSVEVRIETGAEIVAAIADVVAVDRRASNTDPAVAEALRQWRRDKSKELGVPAYVVLHDATIDEIASALPSTERALASISGIGPSKLEHYGDEILALINT